MPEVEGSELEEVYNKMIQEFDLDLPNFPERASVQGKSVSKGRASGGYIPGPDAVTVTNGKTDEELMRNGGHELLHYSHAVKGTGETPEKVKDTLTELSNAVEYAEERSGEQILDEINTIEDIQAAASVKIYEGDWSEFEPDTEGEKHQEVNEFVKEHSEPSQIREKFEYMAPFKERAEEVMELPISTESEADAYFFSLYVKSRHLADEDEEIDERSMFDTLYGGYTDDNFSLYRSLIGNDQRWDEEQRAYVVDGIEQRIGRYSELREEDYTEKEAVGKVLEEGLDNFEEIGEKI